MASGSASRVKMTGVERMRWGREASSGKGGRGPIGVEPFDEPADEVLVLASLRAKCCIGRKKKKEGGGYDERRAEVWCATRTSQVQRHTNLISTKHMLSCFRRLDLGLNLARLASATRSSSVAAGSAATGCDAHTLNPGPSPSLRRLCSATSRSKNKNKKKSKKWGPLESDCTPAHPFVRAARKEKKKKKENTRPRTHAPPPPPPKAARRETRQRRCDACHQPVQGEAQAAVPRRRTVVNRQHQLRLHSRVLCRAPSKIRTEDALPSESNTESKSAAEKKKDARLLAPWCGKCPQIPGNRARCQQGPLEIGFLFASTAQARAPTRLCCCTPSFAGVATNHRRSSHHCRPSVSVQRASGARIGSGCVSVCCSWAQLDTVHRGQNIRLHIQPQLALPIPAE